MKDLSILSKKCQLEHFKPIHTYMTAVLKKSLAIGRPNTSIFSDFAGFSLGNHTFFWVLQEGNLKS